MDIPSTSPTSKIPNLTKYEIGRIGSKTIFAGRELMGTNSVVPHMRFIEIRHNKEFVERPVITITLSSPDSAGPFYNIFNVQWSLLEPNLTQFQFWSQGIALPDLKVYCDFVIIGEIK